MAGVVGSAFFRCYTRQLFQQLLIVPFVSRVFAAEACLVNSGGSAESVNTQTAVFGENPLVDCRRCFRCFFGGVCREGIAIFDHFWNVSEVGNSDDLNSVRLKQLSDLLQLFSVSAADDEP